MTLGHFKTAKVDSSPGAFIHLIIGQFASKAFRREKPYDHTVVIRGLNKAASSPIERGCIIMLRPFRQTTYHEALTLFWGKELDSFNYTGWLGYVAGPFKLG